MLKTKSPTKLPRKVRKEIARLFDDGVSRYTVFERDENLDIFSGEAMQVLSVPIDQGHTLLAGFADYVKQERLGYGILYFPDNHEHVRVYPSGRCEFIDLPSDPRPLVDLGSKVVTKRESLVIAAGVTSNSQLIPAPALVSAGDSLPLPGAEAPALEEQVEEASTGEPLQESSNSAVSAVTPAETDPVEEFGEDAVGGEVDEDYVASPVTDELSLPPTFTPLADVQAEADAALEAARLEAEAQQARLAEDHADELARIVDGHNQQVAALEAEMMTRLHEYETASTEQTNEQVQALVARLTDLETQLDAAQRDQQQAQSEFQAAVATPHPEQVENQSFKSGKHRSHTLAAVLAGAVLVGGMTTGGVYLLSQKEPIAKHVRVHEHARPQALLALQTIEFMREELSTLIDSTNQILEDYKAKTDEIVEFRLKIEAARETLATTDIRELETTIDTLTSNIEQYKLATRVTEANSLLKATSESIEQAGTRVRSDKVIPAAQAGVTALEAAVANNSVPDIEDGIKELKEAKKKLDASHVEWKKVNEANQKARAEREAARKAAEQAKQHPAPTPSPSGNSQPSSSTGGGSLPRPGPAPAPAPSGRVTGISGSSSTTSGSPGAASFSVTVTSSGTANTSVTVSIGGKSVSLGSGSVNGSRTFSGSVTGLLPGTYTWTATAGGASFTGSAITVY